MKKFLILFLLLLFQYNTTNFLHAKSIIKVGIYDNEPLIFTDTDGNGKGLFADIIEYIAEQEGLQIEYVPGTWQQCLSRLENNQVDILCVIAFSKARAKLYDFNKENLLTNWGQLYTSIGSDIEEITDVAGKKVAVLKNDIHYKIFTQNINSFGIECEIIETEDYHSVLNLVSQNQADAGVVNRLFGMRYGSQYHVDKSGIIFNPIKIHFAVPKGKNKKLISSIDRHIPLLKKDEGSVYYRSLDKWFGTISTRWVIPTWIKWVVFAALGFVLLLFLGNIILRNQVNTKTKDLTLELKRRKKAELTLQESEKHYRRLFNLLPYGAEVIDTKGNIIDCNPNTLSMLGYERDELIGKHITTVFHTESIKIFKKKFVSLMRGNIEQADIKMMRKDGSQIEVIRIGQPIFDTKGKIDSILAVNVDVTKRKRAEEELVESKERFKTLSSLTFEGILIHNNGVIIDSNAAATRMVGYTREELIGEDIIQFCVPQKYHAIIKENIVKKVAKPYEVMARRKDGTVFHVEIESNDIKNKKNNFRVTALRDITERKQTEMALISSENKWRNILVNIPQIGITIDTKAKITFANAYFLQLTGWKEKEVIGQDWFDMFIPEHVRKDVREVFLTVMSQKDTIGFSTYENQIIDRSAMLINVAWSNALTKDVHGNVIDVTCLGIDLTERLRSEQALKKSEEKYRSMMEVMDDAAYICSSEYLVEYMNSAMIKRIGFDATGELCHKVIHGLDEKCPWCVYAKVIMGESINYEIVSPKDDKTFHISNSPIVHTDGLISKLTIFRDITQFKKMVTHLQQAQKMESIGTLAGGIAHDFNNILFPIVGHTEMLLEDVPEDSPFKESLNQIYTSTLRAKDLVKQILTFSRQESSELTLMKIQPIVKEVLKLIRSTIPATIEIKQDINPDCGVIKADPTQIHQIVMNIATNAYHAMEETGGELKVRLKEIELGKYDVLRPDMKPGIYACLTITDTGRGMDKELTQKVFDPFFTTKEKGKGTGMGLSVVHGIVVNMNGDIQVYSEPGEGTQFHVYLPVEKNFSEEQVTHSKIEIQGGTEQILLVDDEEAILSMEKRMLERLGYQVTSRTSSIEALEAFRANSDKFDLIITDMAMPNMPGDKLSAELIKIHPDIPILLCTGFSETMSEEKAASLGIKGFLWKPIVMKDLAHKIREVLDKN